MLVVGLREGGCWPDGSQIGHTKAGTAALMAVFAEPTFVSRPLVYVAAPYTWPDPVETHRLIKAVDGMIDDRHVTPLVPT